MAYGSSINVRLSDGDRDRVITAAAAAGIGVSEWVRDALRAAAAAAYAGGVAAPPAPVVESAPALLYCRPCKRRALGYGGSIDWIFSRRGAIRPRLNYRCPAGHRASRILSAWIAPSDQDSMTDPVSWDSIPWQAIRMAADVSRSVAHRHLDQRDEMVLMMYRAGIKPAIIAPVMGISAQTVYAITGTLPEREKRAARQIAQWQCHICNIPFANGRDLSWHLQAH